ncbi:MAG: B12-binding domain-containing radical SAM protein [Desulfobacterales bacterium]|nr:B12-binding domain-containing radical SAM protein [Desulfobacterales bacterium]
MNLLFLTSASPLKSGFLTNEKRPPLGLGILMSILKRDGHKIFFSDEYLQPTRILQSDFLRKNKIDFVCIYTNTVCYNSTLKMLINLQAKRKAKEWNGKIIIGGPHTSVGLKDIPEYVDHVVIGEGEITAQKIINGEAEDRILYGEKVEDIDKLPLPAWEEFIYRNYDWKHPWYDTYPLYTMNTSRGCPFNCRFCSVKSIWGKTYRYMSGERIVDDIQYMIKYYGAKGIYFREDHFTLNKKRTIEFCETLLKKDIKIDWFCETRVDQLDDYEYQKLMRDAGCKVYYIGVESGSQRMLDFYQKGETTSQFIKAFDIAKKLGIKTYASFIVGFPTETREDIMETELFIKSIKPDFIGKNIFIGIPGSELYDFIKENNLYEYEDENHVLYPYNYKKNVEKFYNDNPYFHVYYKKFGVNATLYKIKNSLIEWTLNQIQRKNQRSLY